MLDYLLSSQGPVKSGAFPATNLPNFIVNVAIAAGVCILKPAVERYFGLTNRQSSKMIFDTGISPALNGLSTLHLEVMPEKATIATAVTVVQSIPTPVQVFQEQSTMGAILAILACVVFALVGIILVFQRSGQDNFIVVSSSPAANSGNGNGDSSQPPSRDPIPPFDNWSYEPSGSGGHPPPLPPLPPLPIFDIFYDTPIFHADKSVDTNDEKSVGDMDGAPPPPPPSFPTPVEDGDASNSKASIVRWSFLTLVLSIISFVINRFVKGHGKTQQKVSSPTTSERITVNEVSGNVVAPTLPAITTLSAAVKPVIKPTSPNVLPLVETPKPDASISTLDIIVASVSQPTRRFTNAASFMLVFTCFTLLPYFLQDYIDHHMAKTINCLFPAQIRSPSEALGVVEMTDSIADFEDVAAGMDEEVAAGVDVAPSVDEDIVATTDEDVATSADERDAAGTDQDNAPCTDEDDISTGDVETDHLMKTSDEQEISFSHVVGAGDATLIIYENASPLAVDLKDIFDASEDGIPFHEVFSALSISASSSSNETPVFRKTLTNPVFKFPIKSKNKHEVLSEHVPKTNIPVVQVQTVSKLILEKTTPIVVEKVSSTSKVDPASKENALVVDINKASTSSTESLNPKAESFVSPVSYASVRQQPRQGLSASMRAPSRPRRGLSTSIHAPSSPPRRGFTASIHIPRTPLKKTLNASIHAPTEDEDEDESLKPIPVVDLSPDRRVRRAIDPKREVDIVVLVSSRSNSV